jgi:hypothetical protein
VRTVAGGGSYVDPLVAHLVPRDTELA